MGCQKQASGSGRTERQGGLCWGAGVGVKVRGAGGGIMTADSWLPLPGFVSVGKLSNLSEPLFLCKTSKGWCELMPSEASAALSVTENHSIQVY